MTMKTESIREESVTPPDQTRGFSFNHTMLRVKEPERSLDFYCRIIGMRLLRKIDFPDLRFSLYFLRFCTSEDSVPQDSAERTCWLFGQSGVLELTHNWGTETDPDFSYHDVSPRDSGICASPSWTWPPPSVGSTRTTSLSSNARMREK